MKLLILSSFVVLCAALPTLFTGKNITVEDDGSVHITTPTGKRVDILKTNDLTGQRNIEVLVSGPQMLTKKIKINEQHGEVSIKDEADRIKRTWRPIDQGEVLVSIFKPYQGIVDDVTFEKLLKRIVKHVEKGEIDRIIYDVLERLDVPEDLELYQQELYTPEVQGFKQNLFLNTIGQRQLQPWAVNRALGLQGQIVPQLWQHLGQYQTVGDVFQDDVSRQVIYELKKQIVEDQVRRQLEKQIMNRGINDIQGQYGFANTMRVPMMSGLVSQQQALKTLNPFLTVQQTPVQDQIISNYVQQLPEVSRRFNPLLRFQQQQLRGGVSIISDLLAKYGVEVQDEIHEKILEDLLKKKYQEQLMGVQDEVQDKIIAQLLWQIVQNQLNQIRTLDPVQDKIMTELLLKKYLALLGEVGVQVQVQEQIIAELLGGKQYQGQIPYQLRSQVGQGDYLKQKLFEQTLGQTRFGFNPFERQGQYGVQGTQGLGIGRLWQLFGNRGITDYIRGNVATPLTGYGYTSRNIMPTQFINY